MQSKVDVPVLIIFFNRPNMVAQVFEKIREARPSKLFLYQDGARDGREDDLVNVAKCREVVENAIDWECEVHRLYQTKNFGCDPSEYLAIRWFFNHVEAGIILEDDDVPSVSFFSYCKELLEKYKDDERVSSISGMNHLGKYYPYKEETDYFFASASSIWGWATWKRFFDLWDTQYSFLDDPEKIKIMRKNFLESKTMKSDRVSFELYLKKAREHQKSGKEYYETLVSSTRLLTGGVSIFPCKNMISNIGVIGESTHGAVDIKLLPRATQKVFNIARYELEFPLKHPKEIIVDNRYIFKKEGLMTASIWNHPFRWLECKIRAILYKKKG